MRVHARLTASVVLSLFSLTVIILLLPRSSIGSGLQVVALGKDYKQIWNWGSHDEPVGAADLRLVVFGNSWADDTVEGNVQGKGMNWVEVLCTELKCSSYLNFASSRPSQFSPSLLVPQGALVSNKHYEASLQSPNRTAPDSPLDSETELLPDLAAQIQQFMSLPSSIPPPTHTIFVVQFGLWDIYHFASLEYDAGQSLADVSITELYRQLDILYSHHRGEISKQIANSNSSLEGQSSSNSLPEFRVIIPKLSDPTLLPGWISQRELPAAPTSVAEQQKNAVYLTGKWNSNLETNMPLWLKDSSTPSPEFEQYGGSNEEGGIPVSQQPNITKNILYYDLDKYLTDTLVEHQLQAVNISDGRGFGTNKKLFSNIYAPCVRGIDDEVEMDDVEVNGKWICSRPEEYLFWDEFELGVIANEAIGREIAEMVNNGNTFTTSSFG